MPLCPPPLGPGKPIRPAPFWRRSSSSALLLAGLILGNIGSGLQAQIRESAVIEEITARLGKPTQAGMVEGVPSESEVRSWIFDSLDRDPSPGMAVPSRAFQRILGQKPRPQSARRAPSRIGAVSAHGAEVTMDAHGYSAGDRVKVSIRLFNASDQPIPVRLVFGCRIDGRLVHFPTVQGTLPANSDTGPVYAYEIPVKSAAAEGPRPLRVFCGLLEASAPNLLSQSEAFAWIHPASPLPAPRGAFAVGNRAIHIVDPTRPETLAPQGTPSAPRECMVRLWYPASLTPRMRRAPYLPSPLIPMVDQYLALPSYLKNMNRQVTTHSYVNAPLNTAEPRWPLVLFSPGHGMFAELYTALAEDLASRGYVVAGISHPYVSGAVAFPDGRVIQNETQADVEAFLSRAVGVTAGDMRSTLDWLRSSPMSSQLDFERVGAFGHSFGGATAFEGTLVEPGIRAALDIDGSLFGRSAVEPLARPIGIISAENGFDMDPDLPGAWERLQGPGFRVELMGAAHCSFADLDVFHREKAEIHRVIRMFNESFGQGDPKAILERTRRVTATFFDVHLKGHSPDLLKSITRDLGELTAATKPED